MLTGLELTFMGVTRSNSGLFSTPDFIVSCVGKREGRGERKEGGKKGIGKKRKEGRRNNERPEARYEGILTKVKTKE